MPTKPITICPAPILAANRTERVIGRTETLIVSTKTKKGFKKEGAPEGKKCEKNPEGLHNNLDNKSDNHNGTPIEKVTIRCLVFLNT